ncbi:MAG: polyprenyl synthetase family protein [Nitrospirota bacterium]
MDITRYIKNKKRLTDSFLKAYTDSIKKQKECPARLHEAMTYSLMAGGKRIRPIFCIAAYEAVGGRSDEIVPVAGSLELIHTYSLIHDDLPAMDDDDLRRNKPTNHKVFGEATAILAGDALLTDAFSIIAGVNAPPEMLISVIKELTHACGPEGMVGGQLVDIMLEGKRAGKRNLSYIHKHKTGTFIRGAMRIGAIMANASSGRLNALTKYGEKAGLAFQVIDDILDITGTPEETGKTTGSDIAKSKNTYPSLYGLKKSKEIAKELIKESLLAIKNFDEKAEPLREIAKYMLERRN